MSIRSEMTKIVKATAKAAAKRKMTVKQTITFAMLVSAALPVGWGQAEVLEYDNACREMTSKGYVTHQDCVYVSTPKNAVVVTSKGVVYKITPKHSKSKPDTRLFR